MNTATATYGTFSDFAGGFVAGPHYTVAEAEAARAELISAGEDADDLETLPMCQTCEEPADFCECQ